MTIGHFIEPGGDAPSDVNDLRPYVGFGSDGLTHEISFARVEGDTATPMSFSLPNYESIHTIHTKQNSTK